MRRAAAGCGESTKGQGAGGAHEHAAAEKGAMADAPPQDDAIATMLWQLLQPPRIEGALHVEVRPGRTMVVTQLPYLHPEKFAV